MTIANQSDAGRRAWAVAEEIRDEVQQALREGEAGEELAARMAAFVFAVSLRVVTKALRERAAHGGDR